MREEAYRYADHADLNLTNLLALIFLSASFQLHLSYRVNAWLHRKLSKRRILWIIPKIGEYLQRIFFASYISPEASIGQGLKILYGINIIIGAKVVIGENATIASGITLGSAMPGLDEIRQPTIGNNVMIGTGAKILGGISVGDNVKIGANAVVNKSFGSNVTLAGVPAKVVSTKKPMKN